MTDTRPLDLPSPFIEHWIDALANVTPTPRRALDLAMGRGRHTAVMARAGFRTFGVDIAYDVVHDTVARLSRHGLGVRAWCADLTISPLPRDYFELIVVTRYLQRDLFPSLADALVPGGIMLYETFTEAQRARGYGPTSPDHLLIPGELRSRCAGLETLFYEEVDTPEAVARLVARRSSKRS
jgi:SAM-dependent methyltransferase